MAVPRDWDLAPATALRIEARARCACPGVPPAVSTRLTMGTAAMLLPPRGRRLDLP